MCDPSSCGRPDQSQQIDLLGRLVVAFDLVKGKGAGMRVQPIGVRGGFARLAGCESARGFRRSRRCAAPQAGSAARDRTARPRTRPLPRRQARAASRSGAPNFSSNCAASRSTMACRSASVASVTIASVDQPRLSMPRKPERSATRCFWPSVAGSRFQNTNAPETAHSPGSAARSNTKVSDGSSLMVRGNFSMSASSEFRTARLRIIPGRPRQRIHKAGPLRRPAAGGRRAPADRH